MSASKTKKYSKTDGASKTKKYSKTDGASKKADCGKGKIKRAGYIRRAYQRSDGTMIARSIVNPGCVRDMGRPGKTTDKNKTLPKPDPDIHLSTYGYYLDRPKQKRAESLRRASAVYGNLRVLRRVNLIRNLTGDEKNYKKLSNDIDYLSGRYSKIMGRSKSKNSKKNTK